jgi:hypothetical protein
MKNALLGVLIVLLVTASAACTSGGRHHDTNLPDPKGYNAHFGDMDKNGDGLVSWAEFKAYFPQAEPAVFAAIDLNKDGNIDHDEWHKFKEAHELKHT